MPNLTDEEKRMSQFRIERTKKLEKLYSDEIATKRRYNQNASYKTNMYSTPEEVYAALDDCLNNMQEVSETSKKLYAVNPIYASIINYLADMYMWRYKVIPHKVYSKSKAKLRKQTKDEDFLLIYNLMLEAVDGLAIETKFPSLLTLLYTTGSVYFTTICDEDNLTIDTILLPTKYCRKIGETQYGTSIISFDFSYFNNIGLNPEKLNDYLKSFPKEIQKNYNKYLKDSSLRWQELDPHFSSGVTLNDGGIPTFLYTYAGILDYQTYQANELERNENMLKYIVVHTMPHYEDKLIFEVDEVTAIHKSLKKIVDTGEKTRLITTYGDVHLEKVSENDVTANEVLLKAYQAIFNNGGFNSLLFCGDSVEALKMSLTRDKSMVWKHIQALMNFYSIAVNNWFDFKDYQANIDILPISQYTYNDDIETYKNNATLGVGKLDYIIASGVKQKNIQDQLCLENFLKLDEIVPMQSSYTQTAEDRADEEGNEGKNTEGTSTTSNNKSKESKESEEDSSLQSIEPETKEEASADTTQEVE